MPVTASTRRAALGTILAAPLATVPRQATAATLYLADLVARYERLSAALEEHSEAADKVHWQARSSDLDRLIVMCGRLRGRICLYPSRSMPDVLLKVRAFARSTSYEDGREELTCNLNCRDGRAYLDDIALAVIVDLVGLQEGRRCA